MTQGDYVKQQSVVRRVVDPDTGRSRYNAHTNTQMTYYYMQYPSNLKQKNCIILMHMFNHQLLHHLIRTTNYCSPCIVSHSIVDAGRLVKGDGEIIEEIVSRDQHRAINKVSLLYCVRTRSPVPASLIMCAFV